MLLQDRISQLIQRTDLAPGYLKVMLSKSAIKLLTEYDENSFPISQLATPEPNGRFAALHVGALIQSQKLREMAFMIKVLTFVTHVADQLHANFPGTWISCCEGWNVSS